MARTRRNPVGAHVPTRGGLVRGALAYAERVRAEAVQVFLTNPRGWALPPGDPDQDAAFREYCERHGIPVFVHATYLVNVGSPTPATVASSVRSVEHTLRRAARIGARGVVMHAGSAVQGTHRDAALRQVRENVLPMLDRVGEDGPRLLIEPTAGGGRALASRLDDFPEYLDTLDNHPRVGLCLDTCHVFAAGHDVSTTRGMSAVLTQVDRAVGRARLGLVHANDSRDPVGSTRDRHAHIGDGLIGAEAFRALFTHPVTAGVPMVVETPESHCAEDIALLAKLRDAARRVR